MGRTCQPPLSASPVALPRPGPRRRRCHRGSARRRKLLWPLWPGERDVLVDGAVRRLEAADWGASVKGGHCGHGPPDLVLLGEDGGIDGEHPDCEPLPYCFLSCSSSLI